MGKKFMIVKPTLCCGDLIGIGEIHEFKEYWNGNCHCHLCGKDTKNGYGRVIDVSETYAVHESRVIYLPDDVIEYDQQNNIDETAKA